MAEQLSFGALYVTSELSDKEKTLVEWVSSESMCCVSSPEFEAKDAESVLFDPSRDVVIEWRASGGDNVKCAALTTVQEKTLFLRYNYAKMRCIECLDAFRGNPSQSNAKILAQWYERVRAIREDLARANLRLVLKIVKDRGPKYVGTDDLVSEGNAALLRAIDGFDVGKGLKFSTYLWRSVMKSFSRIARKQRTYLKYFPTENDPDLEEPNNDARDIDHATEISSTIRHILNSDDSGLSVSEIRILELRFVNNKMAYEKIAKILGLKTKDVSTLYSLAIKKLSERLKEQLNT